MSFVDAHDPRPLRRYLSFNADGTVAAVHEFAASVEAPLPAAVEVTDIPLVDFTAITIDPAAVSALNAAVGDVMSKASIVDAAMAQLSASQTALTVSRANTQGVVSMAVAKMVAAVKTDV